jgi:lipoprotein-anchoring transpeptidase ErfK/SrfK
MTKHKTPKGSFVIHAKEINAYSETYKADMPFCCWFSGYEYAIHAGYLPGYPASHGCVRLTAKNAQWFYQWARIGTKVIII